MKMLRTSPDFILHWMILDDWSPVTSIYDFYFFSYFCYFLFIYLSHCIYCIARTMRFHMYAFTYRMLKTGLTHFEPLNALILTLSLCKNIYNNIYNYT